MISNRTVPKSLIGSDLVRQDPGLADLVFQFVNGLDQRLNRMEAAIRSSNLDELQLAAHQLKGTGGGYGYPILTERAARLEKKAGAGVVADCAREFDDLKQVCARIVVDASAE